MGLTSGTISQVSMSISMHFWLQIRLPNSAGDALMSQDAPKNGAMLFELATSAGRSVHAGVLDFSAAHGTVAVPEHLIRNLWGLTTCDGQCHGHVIVTYKKLPKGTCRYLRCLPAILPAPITAVCLQIVMLATHVTLEAACYTCFGSLCWIHALLVEWQISFVHSLGRGCVQDMYM